MCQKTPQNVLFHVSYCTERNFKLSIKANHLAYIESRWYGSRISADCQQKFLFTKHDTSGRFLLVTFFEKQKREDGKQK